MRLDELVDMISSVAKKRSPYNLDLLAQANEYAQNNQEDTTGAFATVSDTSDPHMIQKTNLDAGALRDDPYYVWIKTIAPFINDNPYLPRVYSIKLITDTRKKVRPQYRMEKLHSYSEFPIESIIGIAEKIFPDFEKYCVAKRIKLENKNNVWHQLCRRLGDVARGNDKTDVADELALTAIELVQRAKRTNRAFLFDMGPSNFMLRGTPHGPQLVFIDPLKTGNDEQLNEIVDTQYKVSKVAGSYDLDGMNANRMANSSNGINAGVYAQGSQTADPFTYQKKNFLPSELKNDGYFNYVRAMNPHIKSNPFFPRVYVVELEVDNSGLKVPKYQIEKLVKPTNLDVETVMGLAENLVDGFEMKNPTPITVWGYLCHLLEQYVMGDASIGEYFSSKKLIQALDLIKQVISTNKNFKSDLHANNCMIRMTKFGPQLVITDPIEDRVSLISSRDQVHESKLMEIVDTKFSQDGLEPIDYDIPDDAGTYAHVRQGADPHEVIKRSNKPVADDMFNEWVNAIRFEAAGNQFLPRIYTAQEHGVGVNPRKYDREYQMEKLYHATNFSVKQLMNLGGRLFKNFYKMREHGYKLDSPSSVASAMSYCLVDNALAVIDGSEFTLDDVGQSRSKLLNDALMIVKQLVEDGARLDLNDENFMFRKTPYGPQLVLTDPIA